MWGGAVGAGGGGGGGGVGELACWGGSWGWLLVLGRRAVMLVATLDLIDLDRASWTCFLDLGFVLVASFNVLFITLTSAAFSMCLICSPHVRQ